MTSLVFRTLDQQVIAGLADHPAISDERGTVSYAKLLHDSACIGAGLQHMGIEEGTSIVLDDLRGRDLVIAVLACARLGALPSATGDFRLAGTPPVLHAPDTEVVWDLLERAGRTEPLSAPELDPSGYEAFLRLTFGGIFSTLDAGGTVNLSL